MRPTPHSKPVAQWGRSSTYRVVILGLTIGVLWFSAAGKAVEVINEPMLEDRWFWTILLELELLLSLAILAGRRSRRVWTLAAFIFLVFAVLTGFKAVRGEPDCGCFGAVPMNPWITLGVDLILAALLILLRPRAAATSCRTRPSRLAKAMLQSCAAMTLLAGFGIAIMVSISPPGNLQADGGIEGQGKHVVLTPADWLNHPFPLSPYLPQDAALARGQWEVVLVRPGCPHCLDFLEHWDQQNTVEQRAVISLGLPDEALRRLIPGVAVYSLSQDRRWYAEVPLTLHLDDGIVIQLDTTPTQAPTSDPAIKYSGGAELRDAVWFDGDGKIDLGYIEPGSSHSLAYRIEAPADRALGIQQIISECRCTTITQAPDQIAAGGRDVIVMQFIATDKLLQYDQGVLIRTDHPTMPEQRLVVTARIGLPLSVSPPEVVIDRPASSAEAVSVSVTVTNDGPEPIRLIYAVSDAPGISVRVPSEPISPGQSIDLPIIVQRDRWDGRPTIIRIPTTHPDQTDLFISIGP